MRKIGSSGSISRGLPIHALLDSSLLFTDKDLLMAGQNNAANNVTIELSSIMSLAMDFFEKQSGITL